MAAIPATTQAGATIGTFLLGPAGTIIGACVGATVGVGITAALAISTVFKLKA